MCSRLSTAGSIAAPIDAPSAVRKSWCSRLSTAGSIAAAPTTPAVACGAGVLPPINGGLHCGDPRHARWSPAWPRVLPPINGGLHCGLHRDPTSHRRHLRAPAYQRRAPLRPPTRRHPSASRHGCSRLSTAGSIAALSRECRGAAGHPVLPPINGGLHCGNAAAAKSLFAQLCSRLSTAGSIAAGLLPDLRAWQEGGAPAYQRRAPLRRAGLRLGVTGGDRAPAYQRRAPLRQLRVGNAGDIHPGCSRLSTAGSIAAFVLTEQLMYQTAVLPPINGGLLCGPAYSGCRPIPRSRAPAYQRRAPLRPGPGRHRQQPVLGCSRLSTAGSIAAALPCCRRQVTSSRAPAYQRRAPLRLAYKSWATSSQ